MTRPLPMLLLAAVLLVPSSVLAAPPTFVPNINAPTLLKPGFADLHIAVTGGAVGSFSPAFKPTLVQKTSGGFEVGLTNAVRFTFDGHGGFAGRGIPGVDDNPDDNVDPMDEIVPWRSFAGGRAGARIVGPDGVPEIGFGIGGGAIGGLTDAGPQAPSSGYLAPDVEVLASASFGGSMTVSAVARIGPTIELAAGPDSADIVPTLGFVAQGDLRLAYSPTKSVALMLDLGTEVGFDSGATVEVEAPNGSGYSGFHVGFAFVGRVGK